MTTRTVRLRRSDPSAPGIRRRRRGRGFSYEMPDGSRVTDPETLTRIEALVIPPAWQDVWICLDPRGHLQALGTDAAGRRQYRYHDRWRELRDRKKFEEMVEFGRLLPHLRRRAVGALRDEAAGLDRERVLGGAVRLLDLGLFRIGGHGSGEEDTGLGLVSLRREHVSLLREAVTFDFVGKAGVRHVLRIEDELSVSLIRKLMARRGGPAELLAYRSDGAWRGVHPDDINAYIKAALDERFSAKDFRTWHATVLAAAGLAARASQDPGRSATARKRVMRAVAGEVAEALGNTPTVARASYIDPRVFDRYSSGWVIDVPPISQGQRLGERRHRQLELAVLDLLLGDWDGRVAKAA